MGVFKEASKWPFRKVTETQPKHRSLPWGGGMETKVKLGMLSLSAVASGIQSVYSVSVGSHCTRQIVPSHTRWLESLGSRGWKS